jgi:dolichyl-phosphate beta-glucosyltransferase
MDTDLSTDLSAIDTFLNEIKNYDIVIGSRRHPNSVIPKPQGALRKFIGNCCVVITKTMTGLKLNDTQCGFKGFKNAVAKKIISKQVVENWAFDVEYLYIANLNGYTIKDIPITWVNDEDSKVSPLKSSLSFFGDLFKIVGNKKAYKF